MGQRLKSFPSVPEHIQTVALGDQQYRVEFTYRARTLAWYMDIFQLDDTPILTGRRLSPLFSPTVGLVLENGPDGIMYVRGGFDPYDRGDFDENLQVIRYTVAELEAANAVANPDADARPVIVVL